MFWKRESKFEKAVNVAKGVGTFAGALASVGGLVLTGLGLYREIKAQTSEAAAKKPAAPAPAPAA